MRQPVRAPCLNSPNFWVAPRITTCLSECVLSYHLQFEDYYCKRYCLTLSNKTLSGIIGRIFFICAHSDISCAGPNVFYVRVSFVTMADFGVCVCQIWTRAVFAWK